MKTRSVLYLVLCALCFGLRLSFAAEAVAAATPVEPAVEKIPPERFDAKVVKVFAAKDGAALFRCYVVLWKGQEVIATDPLVKSDYKEGDAITVLALNSPYPQGREAYRLLNFTVVPQRR